MTMTMILSFSCNNQICGNKQVKISKSYVKWLDLGCLTKFKNILSPSRFWQFFPKFALKYHLTLSRRSLRWMSLRKATYWLQQENNANNGWLS